MGAWAAARRGGPPWRARGGAAPRSRRAATGGGGLASASFGAAARQALLFRGWTEVMDWMCWRYGGCVLSASVAVRRNISAGVVDCLSCEALAYFSDRSRSRAGRRVRKKKKQSPTED